MTFNVHQLPHLKDSVGNLGPLSSYSCFFFKDLNGDFEQLSETVILFLISQIKIQRNFSKYICTWRFGSCLEYHKCFPTTRIRRLLRRLLGIGGKCGSLSSVKSTVYHSQSYQRVTAWNNFMIVFQTNEQSTSSYGSIVGYAKIQDPCYQASCRSSSHCQCQLVCHHFAVVQEYDLDHHPPF